MKPRVPGLLLLLLLVAGLLAGESYLDSELKDVATYTGWTLAALTLLLSVYHLRKKVSTLPIGRAWYWRRVHTFLGWVTLALFFIHTGFVPPGGQLGFVTWLAYLLVLVSGVVGLWLSLGIPPRIAQGGERLVFERIPHLREAQRRHADRVILAATADGIGQPLQEFHNRYLGHYLGQSRELWRHWFNTAKTADQLRQELGNIGRYIDKDSRHHVTELEEIISRKHVLDRQYALQYLLKKWVYFHAGLNYMCWAFIVVHVFTSYTFRLEYGL